MESSDQSATTTTKLTQINQFLKKNFILVIQATFVLLMTILFISYGIALYKNNSNVSGSSLIDALSFLMIFKIFIPFLSIIFCHAQSKALLGVTIGCSVISIMIGDVVTVFALFPIEGPRIENGFVKFCVLGIVGLELLAVICQAGMVYKIRTMEKEEEMNTVKRQQEHELYLKSEFIDKYAKVDEENV